MIAGRPLRECMRTVLTIAAASLAAAMPAPPVSANDQIHRIAMNDMAFTPARVTIHAGDTVEWDNGDSFAHTATSKKGGFDVSVPPGHKGRVAITRAGTFNYICSYHPNMKGQIIVKP